MTQTAEHVIGSTDFITDEREYRLLSLPPNRITLGAAIIAETGQPFSALLIDRYEVTLLLRDDVCQSYAKRLHAAAVSPQSYRLITFAEALEPELVGFMARIAEALAKAGVPILACAAYSRDHIFVPTDKHASALKALRSLQDRIRQGS